MPVLAPPPAGDVDAFLDRLVAERYAVGVRERLVVHAFLARLAAEGTLPDDEHDRLRLLRPLLSRDVEEQRRFDEIVGDFLGDPTRRTRQHAIVSTPVRPAGIRERVRTFLRRRRGMLAAALLVTIVVAGVAAWWWQRSTPNDAPAPTAVDSTPLVQPSDTGRTPAAAPAVVRPIYVPVGAFPAPAAAAPPAHRASLGWLRWTLAGIAVALAGALVAWWVSWRRRTAYLQRAQTDEAVEDHVLRDRESVALDVGEARLRPVSRLLRQRVAGGREELDLTATIHATARNGGALTPRFRSLRQTPEYVVLVDRVSPHDHQAAFHELLVDALARNGVAVDVFHFSGSPASGCWRERVGSPTARGRLSVAQLSNRYGGHRLLVFGDAASAFDALTGDPLPWTRHAGQFPLRAWFTPLPVASWGGAEGALDALGFLALPAEPEALESLAEWLASDRATLDAADDWPGAYPSMLREGGATWVARQTAPPADAHDDLLLQLRSYLGPERFQWLSGCAVFPAISWPLTLALGRVVLPPAEGGGADTRALARGMAALGALPWFRHGRMPDWLRESLLARLEPRDERRLRALVEQRLGAAIAGGGETLAEVAVRRHLVAWFGRRTGMARDVILAGFLESRLAPRLAQRVPDPLKRLLFRRGVPLYGVKGSVIAGAALAAVSCAAAVSPGVWERWTPRPPAPRAATRTSFTPYAVLRGSQREERGLAFSPDGRYVARGGSDSVVYVWSVTGGELVVLRGHDRIIDDIAFSPDGRLIVSGSRDTTVRVWHADGRGAPLVLRGHGGAVYGVAFSPDGGQVASASADGTVRVWTVDRSATRLVLRGGGAFFQVAFSPDGTLLATSEMTGIVRLWDARSGREVRALSGHEDGVVFTLKFSRDGRWLASAASDGTARVWRVDDGITVSVLRHPAKAVSDVDFDPTGRLIVSAADDGILRLWRWTGERGPEVIDSASTLSNSVAFAPDGRSVALAGISGTVSLAGAPPGIAVAVAACTPSAADDSAGVRIANALADLPTSSSRYRYSPVVYSRAAWDSTRLGPPPDLDDVRLPKSWGAATDSLATLRRALDGTRPPGKGWRFVSDGPAGMVTIGACARAAPIMATRPDSARGTVRSAAPSSDERAGKASDASGTAGAVSPFVAPSSAPGLPAEYTFTDTIGPNSPAARVRVVQEWLSLNGVTKRAVDGAFGVATQSDVRAFQQQNGLPATGVVDRATFERLVAPMTAALRPIAAPPGATFGQMMVAYARQHLAQRPREVGGANMGPWVRLYMDGNQGADWGWAAGFVTVVMRQAAAALGVPSPLRRTFNIDELARQARTNGALVDAADLRLLEPGDLFLVRKATDDWLHVGIVISAERDAFHTIEGDTNDEGARDGFEVAARVRGYDAKDFIRLSFLTRPAGEAKK